MANTKISQWTEQTLSNMAAAGTSDLLGGINTTSGSQNRKFSLATIANFILSKFKPSALSGIGDGSTTGAISSLNSNVFIDTITVGPNIVDWDTLPQNTKRYIRIYNVEKASLCPGAPSGCGNYGTLIVLTQNQSDTWRNTLIYFCHQDSTLYWRTHALNEWKKITGVSVSKTSS